jgi:hypothetical protein
VTGAVLLSRHPMGRAAAAPADAATGGTAMRPGPSVG